jgi:aspartyl-tRNA(Asn)/glutamyl-tRNA(Gln) amidotransferase subunit C
MKLDRESLLKVAHLARLEIKPEEEAALLNSMDSVLTWMDQLNSIDTNNVEPLTHISGEYNNWREDVGANTLSREEAVSNAPSKTDTYIMVPKVIE